MKTQAKHILIIEDDEDLRELMSELLSFEGYSVSTASNGQVGLELLLVSEPKALPDLIILDSQMPVLNGAQFIKAIEKLKRSDIKRIPILLSSGLTENTQVGIPSHIKQLQKPYELSVMMQTIAEFS